MLSDASGIDAVADTCGVVVFAVVVVPDAMWIIVDVTGAPLETPVVCVPVEMLVVEVSVETLVVDVPVGDSVVWVMLEGTSWLVPVVISVEVVHTKKLKTKYNFHFVRGEYSSRVKETWLGVVYTIILQGKHT